MPSPVVTLDFTKKKKTFAAPAPLAPIADTHAHLTCFWGKDPAEVLARAALAGERMLITLLDPVADGLTAPAFHERLEGWIASARAIVEASLEAGVAPLRWGDERTDTPAPRDPMALFDNIRYLVGVHPYGTLDYTDEVHAQLIAALDDPLCAGIGEIGLDYHFDAEDDIEAAPHGRQMEVMARQLAVAVERNLPVELHLRHEAADERRTSHEDAYRVLTEVGVPAAGCILHCFGEDRACMERFVELGCSIAFGGAATFKRNDAVREAFAACPLDRILLETDCPYMAPEPIRGIECEPAMISFTARALCEGRAALTGEAPGGIARALWDNANRIFGGRS